MQYCLVENGKIKQGPCALPKNFKSVSGFNLDPGNAKQYGWLPAVVTKEEFNQETHKQGKTIRKIEADLIKIIYPVEALTTSEQQQRVNTAAKQEIENLEKLQTLRRIAEAAPDDAGGDAAGRAWMKENRLAIKTERAKIVE
ncbi:MAG: hypothetical protein HQL71_13170 [Magnetococcales bacterium]|nr:hypothetical protein [Magnetococcales bacterium]